MLVGWAGGIEDAPDADYRVVPADLQDPLPAGRYVAHGRELSLGTVARDDAARRARYLARVAAAHARLAFLWYAEPLGATVLNGEKLGVAVPLPMSGLVARTVRGRLRAMRRVVPRVAVHRGPFAFAADAPLEEPAFIAKLLGARGTFLSVDLDALVALGPRFGFAVEEYFARLPVARILELVAGAPSAGALPSVLARLPRLTGLSAKDRVAYDIGRSVGN